MQSRLAFEPIAADPLARTAHADTGGLGRRRQRPTFDHDPLHEPTPTLSTESRVTVKLHPGPPSD